MGADEGKNEALLKRIQILVAILASVATLIVGAYNVKNIFFKKPEPEPVKPPPKADKLREAVEDVGAAWIKRLGAPKSDQHS